MIDKKQEEALEKLVEIENKLPNGVSLTFAVDNMVETMEKKECNEFLNAINQLLANQFLASHTDKATKNSIPYWLELTNQGREYYRRMNRAG